LSSLLAAAAAAIFRTGIVIDGTRGNKYILLAVLIPTKFTT